RLPLLLVAADQDGFEFSGHVLFLPRSERSAFRSVWRAGIGAQAAPAEKLLRKHHYRTDRNEGVGEIEDGKRPDRRMEQDVVDDMSVYGAVDEIADGAAADQRKTGSGEPLVRGGADGEIEHEGDDGERYDDQPGVAEGGQHRKGYAGVVGSVERQ